MNKIAILGVGLIGASLGKALLKNGVVRVVTGFGRRRTNLETALESGCITEIADRLEDAVRDAEIIVVCTPVETIAQIIRYALPFAKSGAVFTDVGSTKASLFEDFHGICEAHGCAFIGGHPIAGKETSGAAAADENLFQGKTVVLTNRIPENAFHSVEDMWKATGARVVFMSATEHDAVLAQTSHLPHLLACVLSAVTEPKLYPFSGTGYNSMTRLAAGSPEVWRDILTDNKQNILTAMDQFTASYCELREILENGDTQALENYLTRARENRNRLTLP
ncbi:MAG: prephenate dehydrogenase [Planctomycetia bacterium]|nr:prephenate dehydrogenase [Planctomycetia bacterium]